MAKAKQVYVCRSCARESARWMGRCPGCGEWNTFEEAAVGQRAAPASLGPAPQAVQLHEVPMDGGGELRVRTGIGELDNALGGGLVAGSLVLLGGDPGVGKSTLLLMALARFAARGLPVLYVSAEESPQQVRLRADRLGIEGPGLYLLAETDWARVESTARSLGPRVLVVDSVQTVCAPDLDGIPGSVAQVREVAHRAMRLAKETGIATFLVGHVTKSGQIAGPKILEHFVDTVLYFEGDGRNALRVVRAVKNRFGAAGELGLFEMFEEGLREVPDASARLLSERVAGASGTAVAAAREGSRSMLAEVQALVGPAGAYTPSRTCVGVDRTRVTMLLAVLGKLGFALHDRDVFVNAAGGVRLDEPATDLAAVAAIASSLRDRPVADDVVLLGEVGLVGEVRAVAHPRERLREAGRHGFRRVIAPHACADDPPAGVQVVGVRTVAEALDAAFE